MGDYVSANGRSFPALLVMPEIDGTLHIHRRTRSRAYTVQWMEGCLSGLLSWTGSVKDGETGKGRGQRTKTDERKKPKQLANTAHYPFSSLLQLFSFTLSNDCRNTKISITQAKTQYCTTCKRFGSLR